MAKICGWMSADAEPGIAAERLRLMVGAIKHDPHAQEEWLYVERGGIAIVKPALSQRCHSASDEQRNRCVALCGQITDRDRGQSAVEHRRHAAEPASDSDWLSQILQHGDAALETLRGTFVCAYYDCATHSLAIANDRYGFVPLYYYVDEHIFVFASEVKAILQVVAQRELDWESCADFWYIGHMIGQKTLFKHIYALDAGQILTWRDGQLSKRTYTDFTQTDVLAANEVAPQQIADLFVAAIRARVHVEHPGTLLLSGGFDSRFILGALHSLGVAPRIVSLEHSSEAQGADGQLARLLAESLGLACDYRETRKAFFTSNEWLEVFYILDGMIPTWQLFISEVYPEIEPQLGIVWDGLALDVALGGSHQGEGGTAKNLRAFVARRRLNRFLLKLILTPRQFRALDRTFMQRLQREVAKIPASENQFLLFLLKHRTRRRIAVNPYQLYASKVEPVTPATDITFLDYVLRIPSRLKLNHKLYIQTLQQQFPVLTQIPVVSGGAFFDLRAHQPASGAQPKLRARTTFNKRMAQAKRLFATIRRVLRGRQDSGSEAQQLSAFVIHILEQRNFDRHFYNTRLLRKLFSQYRNGAMLYHKLFTAAFYIELWHLLFIDQESPILFNPKAVDRLRKDHN